MPTTTKRVRFTVLRNLLMEQHGWDRRVATLATRYYNGVDMPEDWEAAACGDYGRSIISQEEIRMIAYWR